MIKIQLCLNEINKYNLYKSSDFISFLKDSLPYMDSHISLPSWDQSIEWIHCWNRFLRVFTIFWIFLEYDLTDVSVLSETAGWGLWTEWNACSSTCGLGKRQRNRLCDNPPPLPGGNTCDGDEEETEACSTDCYGIVLKLLINIQALVSCLVKVPVTKSVYFQTT
jgi:hypothetical protein